MNPIDHAGTGRSEAVVLSLDQARLLVVDDEENLRITTAAILEKEGYDVDTASSGNEAIELLAAADYDLEKEGYDVDTASSGNEAIELLAAADYDLVLTDLHMEAGE